MPRATWLTFRRTYSSWSHERGVPERLHSQQGGRRGESPPDDMMKT
jgi:hypothetical protein